MFSENTDFLQQPNKKEEASVKKPNHDLSLQSEYHEYKWDSKQKSDEEATNVFIICCANREEVVNIDLLIAWKRLRQNSVSNHASLRLLFFYFTWLLTDIYDIINDKIQSISTQKLSWMFALKLLKILISFWRKQIAGGQDKYYEPSSTFTPKHIKK